MTAIDWAGSAVTLAGLALALDLGGLARGAAELLRWLKHERKAGTVVAMPTTAWGLRLLGVALVVGGACLIVAAAPS